MEYLPVCLRLQDTPVLLVGGGAVATRKARLLHSAGARLTVAAPALSAELAQLLETGGGRWREVCYQATDL
ncbi:MAG: bifunctional precorrin-2 dehydrogenase/sirohydrochlorin ferrochelatase, partial [Parahaliea sp.]